jgi:malate/lactate dehydrogenase
VKLGKNGIEQVLELKLDAAETTLLHESAASVREVVDVMNAMNLA